MVDHIKLMTADEYFELPESKLIIQLIEGEVIEMPGASPTHQDVVGNIFMLLRLMLKVLGGKAYIAPLDVYLDDLNVFQPDVMWVAPNSQAVIGDKRIVGAPDLIAEVLSPGSERHDRKVKFDLYEQYGVREYWIVSPESQLIEVWLIEDNKFTRQGIYEPSDTFTSAVLAGQRIEVKVVFGD
jgi:Uma2 family endonuclease